MRGTYPTERLKGVSTLILLGTNLARRKFSLKVGSSSSLTDTPVAADSVCFGDERCGNVKMQQGEGRGE
jgi:hypothetical protein